MGSVHFNDVSTMSPNMHIRFANRVSFPPATIIISAQLFFSLNLLIQQKMFPSSWDRRNKLEKVLLVIAFSLFIVCCVLIVLSVREADTSAQIRQLHQSIVNSKVPCLEKHCIYAANEILRSIDDQIDPCDDFYAFSCNQWIKNNPIPDGKSMWGTFGKLEQQNQMVVKTVLERNYTEFNSTAEKKAKMYFESCIDNDEMMEKLGAQPMMKLLQDIGGWNVTPSDGGEKFNVQEWTLQKILQKLHNTYNMGGLFGWAVGEDDRNSSQHIIQIDQGGLTLPTRDNYINRTEQHEKILVAYLDYMTKIGVLLGAKDENDTRRQMKEVIDFETRLAEITVPNEQRRDEESMYNLMTLAELQELAPFINWHDHFEDAFRLVKRKIQPKEKVVVYSPSYLKNLTALVNNYTKTDEGKM